MKVAFIFSFLLLSFLSDAQKTTYFEQLSKHTFTDGRLVGDLHKFRHVFIGTEPDYKLFKKFNRARITQKTINVIIASGIAFGGFVAIIDANSCGNNTQCGLGAGIALAFDIGLVVIGGITNLIVASSKKKRKKKLLDNYFDQTVYSHLSRTDKTSHLKLGITKNGLGLTIGF